MARPPKKLVPAGTPNDGLPESFQPIEAPPIFTGSSSAPPSAFSGPSPTFAASIPLSAQLTPDIMPTRYPGGIGGYRIFPSIPAGVAGVNAAIKSFVQVTAGSEGLVTLTMPPQFLVTESQIPSGELIAVAWTPEIDGTFLAAPPLPTLIFNSVSADTNTSGSPQTSYAITVTASTPGIAVGDTAFATVALGSGLYVDPLAIGTVTDSLGNDWQALSDQFNWTELTNVSGQVAQIWYAVIKTAVAAGATFTLTATYSGGTTSSTAAIYFYNAPGSIMGALGTVTNHSYPTSASLGVSGGPITAATNAVVMQWAMPGADEVLPADWTQVYNPGIGVYASTNYLIGAPGTYSTFQTCSAASGGYVAMAVFALNPAFGMGIPAFRFIVPSDVPPINLEYLNTNGGITGILGIPNGGTGTFDPSLVAGTNITITGSWPNQHIAAAGFADPMTTKGDTIYENATPAPARLAIGTTGQVLTVASGLPSWATPTVYMTNPMTTADDLIVGGASGAPTRLAVGTAAQVLTVSGAGAVEWANASSGFANPMTTEGDIIFENATPAPDRLPIGTNGQILTVVSGLPAWGSGGGGGAPTTDEYILGAQDFSDLPNSVAIPGLYQGADVQPATAGTIDDEFNGSSLSGSWTWVNQGGGTATIAGSRLGLVAPNNSGQSYRYIYKAAPSTPWRVTMQMQVLGIDQNYWNCGLLISDGTKLMVVGGSGNVSNIGTIGVQEWTSTTAFSASVGAAYWNPGGIVYVSVEDDGTNLTFWTSPDGIHFTQLYQAARGAFLSTGPTRVGIGVDMENNTSGSSLLLVSDWFRRVL